MFLPGHQALDIQVNFLILSTLTTPYLQTVLLHKTNKKKKSNHLCNKFSLNAHQVPGMC